MAETGTDSHRDQRRWLPYTTSSFNSFYNKYTGYVLFHTNVAVVFKTTEFHFE